MPIPPFNEDGLLPAGVHRATLDEVLERFGRGSEERRVIGESLAWTVAAARRAGVRRLVLDGSYIDKKRRPNDVDCVALLAGEDSTDQAAQAEFGEGIPYAQIIFFAEEDQFEQFLRLEFMTDRSGRPRGVVEVLL